MAHGWENSQQRGMFCVLHWEPEDSFTLSWVWIGSDESKFSPSPSSILFSITEETALTSLTSPESGSLSVLPGWISFAAA